MLLSSFDQLFSFSSAFYYYYYSYYYYYYFKFTVFGEITLIVTGGTPISKNRLCLSEIAIKRP